MAKLTLASLRRDLKKLKDPQKAKNMLRFFKTGKGQYGEGDIFLGINVPAQRIIAKKYTKLNLLDLQKLLLSKIHEERLISLFILVDRYKKGNVLEKEKIVKFYFKNTKNINNWDLVDSSAPYILGDYFFQKNKDSIYRLAKSKNLWEKRIAVVTTFGFIRKGSFEDVFKIYEILLKDKHDLIQKAVGWMLREIGKRNLNILFEFLNKNYKAMSRTTLRYAIEKLTDAKRKYYMS